MAVLRYDQVTAPDFTGVSSILRGANTSFSNAGTAGENLFNDISTSLQNRAKKELVSRLNALTPEQWQNAGRNFSLNPENQKYFDRLNSANYDEMIKAANDARSTLLTEKTNKALRDLTLFKNAYGLKDGGEVLSTLEGKALWDSFSDEEKAAILAKDPSYSILSDNYVDPYTTYGSLSYKESFFPQKESQKSQSNIDKYLSSIDTNDPFAFVKREESSNDITSVGKEKNGSRSYGLYQFNSNVILPDFIDWIKDQTDTTGEYSELASILAYPKEYWNTQEGENTWKTLTKANSPWRNTIEELSSKYATEQYRDIPSRQLSKESKTLLNSLPLGAQVITSASVQHGAGTASKIINEAAKNSSSVEEFISNIYKERAKLVENEPTKNNILDRYAREQQAVLTGNTPITLNTQDTSVQPSTIVKTIDADDLLISNEASKILNGVSAEIASQIDSNKAKLDSASNKLGLNPLSYVNSIEANKLKPISERLNGSVENILKVLGVKDKDFNVSEVRLKLLDAFQYAIGKGFNPELAEGLILNSLSKYNWGWRSIFGENARPTKYEEIFSKIDPAVLDSTLRNIALQTSNAEKISKSSLELIENLKARKANYDNLMRRGAVKPAELERLRFYRDLDKLTRLSPSN